MLGGLGRKEPVDWVHVDKYPLTAYPPTAPTPVVLGINWYTRFDNPSLDSNGRYWAAKPGDNLGSIRGGHAICVKPKTLVDNIPWWSFYNQGATGECVGFSISRLSSLINSARYQAPWLYMQATLIDPWPDNDLDPNSGTSVNAGFEVLKDKGHIRSAWTEPQLS
jgi:hypothetical protein